MHKFYAPLLLFVISYLSLACCELAFANSAASAAANHQNTLLSEAEQDAHSGVVGDPSNYDKRVERYAFGLGRRAYTYTNGGSNGVKRLPVYNFGLGKRARPYSFGLGKRAEYDDDQYDSDAIERVNSAYNLGYMDEKRNRPYSFGLGKRDTMDDVERRGYPNRYGFGLGRR